MIITQDSLIRQIADREGINVATVRDIFKTAENVIFDHLSSTPPSQLVTIKLLKGVSIDRRYIPAKTYSKGIFEDIDCPAKVKIKASISKYLNNRINDEFNLRFN